MLKSPNWLYKATSSRLFDSSPSGGIRACFCRTSGEFGVRALARVGGSKEEAFVQQ